MTARFTQAEGASAPTIHESRRPYAMTSLLKPLSVILVAAVLALGTTGCSGASNTAKGAAVGAGAGGVVGGLIGAATGSTAAGIIIGAVVGGAAGAAIGREMDKQAAELQEDLGDEANVERIGEGIAVTFRSGILFDFDSSALRSEARANLSELATSLANLCAASIFSVRSAVCV